jgi:DNA-binding transcriptional LysR family regulator
VRLTEAGQALFDHARAVAAGVGVAILPMRIVRELSMVGEVQALQIAPAPPLVRQLYLLQLKERPAASAAQQFIGLLMRDRQEPGRRGRAR